MFKKPKSFPKKQFSNKRRVISDDYDETTKAVRQEEELDGVESPSAPLKKVHGRLDHDSISGRDNSNFNNHNDEDENDTDNEVTGEKMTSSNFEKIAAIKRKRKLLTEMQYRRGTDSTLLMPSACKARYDSTGVPSNSCGSSRDIIDVGRSDSNGGADSRISPTGSASLISSMISDTTQEGILQYKHAQAMNEFIDSRLRDVLEREKQKQSQQPNQQNQPNQHQQQKATRHGDCLDDTHSNHDFSTFKSDDSASQTLENVLGSQNYEDHSNREKINSNDTHHNNSKNSSFIDNDDEGVVGVGGTGIDEVILPVDHRFETLKRHAASLLVSNSNSVSTETPIATKSFSSSASNNHNHDKIGCTGGNNNNILPTRAYQSKNTSVPNRFASNPFTASAMTHNHPSIATDVSEVLPLPIAPDDDRIGFEAARRRDNTTATSRQTQYNHYASEAGGAHLRKPNRVTAQVSQNLQQPVQLSSSLKPNSAARGSVASDDRIYQKFVSRQRERNHRK